MKLEFFIDRHHNLTDGDGTHLGRFESEAAADDFATRMAQDLGLLYAIYYPL